MSDKWRLTAIVPDEMRGLLEDFGYANKMKVSDAIRLLLAESPRLVEFAAKEGRQIDFEVDKPGGYRERKGDS